MKTVMHPVAFARRVRRKLRPGSDLSKLCFVHLPKCGGSSMDDALSKLYDRTGLDRIHLSPHGSRIAAEQTGMPMADFRAALLSYHLRQGARYVSGHYTVHPTVLQVNSVESGGNWSFLTVLRDPVSRWYSAYFYNRYKANRSHFAIDMPLSEYVETERARRNGMSYSNQLGGGDIDMAIDSLSMFSFVGALEDMTPLLSQVGQFVGQPLSFGHERRSPRGAEEREEEVTPEIDARVREICAPDQCVYEAAKDLSSTTS